MTERSEETFPSGQQGYDHFLKSRTVSLPPAGREDGPREQPSLAAGALKNKGFLVEDDIAMVLKA